MFLSQQLTMTTWRVEENPKMERFLVVQTPMTPSSKSSKLVSGRANHTPGGKGECPFPKSNKSWSWSWI